MPRHTHRQGVTRPRFTSNRTIAAGPSPQREPEPDTDPLDPRAIKREFNRRYAIACAQHEHDTGSEPDAQARHAIKLRIREQHPHLARQATPPPPASS